MVVKVRIWNRKERKMRLIPKVNVIKGVRALRIWQPFIGLADAKRVWDRIVMEGFYETDLDMNLRYLQPDQIYMLQAAFTFEPQSDEERLWLAGPKKDLDAKISLIISFLRWQENDDFEKNEILASERLRIAKDFVADLEGEKNVL